MDTDTVLREFRRAFLEKWKDDPDEAVRLLGLPLGAIKLLVRGLIKHGFDVQTYKEARKASFIKEYYRHRGNAKAIARIRNQKLHTVYSRIWRYTKEGIIKPIPECHQNDT